MNRTTTAPLRASCERCRAQKLRCVPTSDVDVGAPCQRCVSAKVSESCIFGPRSRTTRTGRCRKLSGSVDVRPGMPRKDKDSSTSALPGMSTFALSGSSSPSPEVESPHSRGPFSTTHDPRMLSLDDDTVAINGAPEGRISDFWRHDPRALDSFSLDAFLRQPSNLLFGTNGSGFIDDISAAGQADGMTVGMETNDSIGSSTQADFHGLSNSPADTPRVNSGVDMDMSVEERPGPLVDLTTLLVEMSAYENRLSKLSGGELNDYPVGDALFFSHRFHAILSDYRRLPSTDPTSQLSMPTMLLALSCFMTLTQIYLPIFGHLHDQLSRMLEAHSAYESRSCTYPSIGADIHSYRGLRLGQLQPICLCTGWDPAKKAVSMLLSSLSGVEGWLGLPPDVRIIADSGVGTPGEQMSGLTGVGGAKTVLFEEGSMAALTTGHLYKTVGRQAKELRGKIEVVEGLLKEVRDTSYVLRMPPELGKE